MAATILPAALAGFNHISPCVWLHDPLKSSVQASSTSIRVLKVPDPDIVFLASWMGASLRHIAKYTRSYQSLYPSARIVVSTNTVPDITFRFNKSTSRKLQPAVELIRSYLDSCNQKSPRVLLHIFSNGGSHQAIQLAQSLRAPTSAPLPIAAMIMDSCPGRDQYKRGVAAISVGLPKNPILNALGVVVAHILMLVMRFCQHILGVENFVDKIRRLLNDTSLFPVAAPRCYLYSKTDAMVGWEDVEDHVADAKSKGYNVLTTKFVQSRHVSHIVEDENLYWGAVQECWEKGAAGLS